MQGKDTHITYYYIERYHTLSILNEENWAFYFILFEFSLTLDIIFLLLTWIFFLLYYNSPCHYMHCVSQGKSRHDIIQVMVVVEIIVCTQLDLNVHDYCYYKTFVDFDSITFDSFYFIFRFLYFFCFLQRVIRYTNGILKAKQVFVCVLNLIPITKFLWNSQGRSIIFLSLIFFVKKKIIYHTPP